MQNDCPCGEIKRVLHTFSLGVLTGDDSCVWENNRKKIKQTFFFFFYTGIVTFSFFSGPNGNWELQWYAAQLASELQLNLTCGNLAEVLEGGWRQSVISCLGWCLGGCWPFYRFSTCPRGGLGGQPSSGSFTAFRNTITAFGRQVVLIILLVIHAFTHLEKTVSSVCIFVGFFFCLFVCCLTSRRLWWAISRRPTLPPKKTKISLDKCQLPQDGPCLWEHETGRCWERSAFPEFFLTQVKKK